LSQLKFLSYNIIYHISNISITNNRLPLKYLLQILDNYSEINYRKTIYKILLSVNFNRKIYKAVYKLLA